MYNRSPSRNHRSRGFKAKHVLQICVLVAVCLWLIYQVKHSHEKKKEFSENGGKLASETHDGREVLRLGRKDIPGVTEDGTDDKSLGKDVEEIEEDEQVEDDAGKGGSDNEIDEHGKENIDDENHEEFEGAEREGEEIDENHEDNQEVETVLEDHEEEDQEGGDEITHGAREQHYKGDDASSEVAQATGTIVPDTDNTTAKLTDENVELMSDVKKNVTENSNEQLLKENPQGAIFPSSMNLTSNSSDVTQTQNTTYGDNTREVSNTKVGLFSKENNTDSVSGGNQLDTHAVKNNTQHLNNTFEGSLGSSGELKLPTVENVTGSVPVKTDDGNSTNADTDKIRSSNSETVVATGGNKRPVSDTNVDTNAADPREHKGDFGHSLAQKEKEGGSELPEIKAEVQNAGGAEAE